MARYSPPLTTHYSIDQYRSHAEAELLAVYPAMRGRAAKVDQGQNATGDRRYEDEPEGRDG